MTSQVSPRSTRAYEHVLEHLRAKRVRITASFRIDKIVWDKNLANSSIIQELLTSPTSLVDKAITTVFGRGNQQYSIDEVYT